MRSRTYRYRTPGMSDWATVTCFSLTEAKAIIRMELNSYSSDPFKLPRGTIIERVYATKPRLGGA